MTKLIGIFIACLLLVGGGVFIQGHFPSRLACTTEEIQRATAPDGGATAIYENAFCDENPSVLEVRVLLVPGLAVQRTSWQRIFLGQAPLVKSADRITRERKLDIKWENSTTLAITTYPEVKINAETISAGTSAIQVVINNKRLILEQDVAKLAAEQKDELHVLFIYLRFVADEKIRDDALALLYRNFGKQEFEPVVDALWNLSEKEFPDFDWQALKEPISRLKVAALRGQWHREFQKERGAAETSAAYAREQVASSSQDVRLEAIGALGAVGGLSDRKFLSELVMGENQQMALRAVSAIYAIERASGDKDSILRGLASSTKNELVRTRILDVIENRVGK